MLSAVAALFLFVGEPAGLEAEKTLGRFDLYAELSDPYYAAAGTYLLLGDGRAPSLSGESERAIYSHLLSHVFQPNCMLAEIGMFPLPLLGAAVKAWKRDFYDKAALGSTNLIRAATATVNFPEPWSVSLFIGRTATFVSNDSSREGRGHLGLLASYGNYHIKDNSIYLDHWGEFELKMKIDKSGKDRRYATSYRIGARIHSHPDVKDFLYLSLVRNRTDFDEPRFSLVRNTNFVVRTDFSVDPAQFLRATFEAGKKYPIKTKRRTLVLGLSGGFTWELHNPYGGSLGEGFTPDRMSLILRPLVNF